MITSYDLLISGFTTDGFPCVFLFNYKGNTFNSCTSYDAHMFDDKFWCSTVASLDAAGTEWKFCAAIGCGGDDTPMDVVTDLHRVAGWTGKT